MSKWTKEEYDEYMRNREIVDSVKLSTISNEVDWGTTLADLANKANEKDEVNIILPIHLYPQLVVHTVYAVGKYIHIN